MNYTRWAVIPRSGCIRLPMNIPSPKRAVEIWSALVGISGSTYLELLEDIELIGAADAMPWPLLVVGAAGSGSILFGSWRRYRSGRLAPRS